MLVVCSLGEVGDVLLIYLLLRFGVGDGLRLLIFRSVNKNYQWLKKTAYRAPLS